ncbi:hypothetical protein V5O48_008627 [Marasmius crinis-equi]|uniref:DUF159-domain-containing protein n=1 Tax=Marasmius crinis-equi TaxID=585013 RepID=A0ABR3FDD7_9AGAR
MCGRFALHRQRQEIRDRSGYNLDIGEWIDEDQFVPRYNIAPHTNAPVIRRRRDGFDRNEGPSEETLSESANASQYVMQSMKWGLVPHWSKHEDKTLNTTNARSENLVEGGGMWASMKGKRRCVIVCEGYYEWLHKGKDKLPHFTKHADGRLMLLAGLYDCALLEGQTQPTWTFTIVTTAANKDFEWLHERQPVILTSQSALEKWLDTSPQTWTSELSKMVQPYSDSNVPLEWFCSLLPVPLLFTYLRDFSYQVPKEVGKVGTESPSYIVPISQRKDGIQAMFSKQKLSQSKNPEPKSSPIKRKRSPSPHPKEHCDDEVQIVDNPEPSSPPPKKAKRKAESFGQAKSSQALDKSSQKSNAVKTPSKGKKSPGNKGQITAFFAKS